MSTDWADWCQLGPQQHFGRWSILTAPWHDSINWVFFSTSWPGVAEQDLVFFLLGSGPQCKYLAPSPQVMFWTASVQFWSLMRTRVELHFEKLPLAKTWWLSECNFSSRLSIFRQRVLQFLIEIFATLDWMITHLINGDELMIADTISKECKMMLVLIYLFVDSALQWYIFR